MCVVGASFESFTARSSAAMAAFRDEMASSRPAGRWGYVSVAEAGGSYKGAVRYEKCLEDSDPLDNNFPV